MEIVPLSKETNRDDGLRYLAIGRDIDDRVKVELALKQANHDVRKLLKLTNGLLAFVTLNNDGSRRSFRLSPLSPTSKLFENYGLDLPVDYVEEVSHPEDRAAIRAAYLRARDHGEAAVDARHAIDNGQYCLRHFQVVLVERRADSFDVVLYGADITREQEARRRALQAERLATLGEVTTNIAHEINQPLGMIMLAADGGKRALNRVPPAIEDASARFDRIVSFVERVDQVMRHIRGFTRGDDVECKPFQLAEVLADASMVAESRLHTAGAHLDIDLPANLPALSVSRVGLEQALLNLINNACDAYVSRQPADGTPGFNPIRITAACEGDVFRIEVRDQAGGIASELLDRIFEPFFSTKTASGGTGLGLAFSRTSIEEMGGCLTARNAAGGAVFEITLPLAPISQAETMMV